MGDCRIDGINDYECKCGEKIFASGDSKGYVIESSLLLAYGLDTLFENDIKMVKDIINSKHFPLRCVMNIPKEKHSSILDITYTYDLKKLKGLKIAGTLIMCVGLGIHQAKYDAENETISLTILKDVVIEYLEDKVSTLEGK